MELLEHGDQFGRGLLPAPDFSLLDSLPCKTCQAFFSTIFGAGRGVGILRYKCLSPRRCTTFLCSQLAPNHKGEWRETTSARVAILFLVLFPKVTRQTSSLETSHLFLQCTFRPLFLRHHKGCSSTCPFHLRCVLREGWNSP